MAGAVPLKLYLLIAEAFAFSLVLGWPSAVSACHKGFHEIMLMPSSLYLSLACFRASVRLDIVAASSFFVSPGVLRAASHD